MRKINPLPNVNEFKPKARLHKRQTEEDKEDANPFDTSPKNEQEARHGLMVEAALKGMSDALAKHRAWIRIEDLMLLTHAHVEMEGELPEVEGIRHGMFFFSISGRLEGRPVTRVLVGGDCIIVSAPGPAEARMTAQQGLEDTITSALEYANKQAFGDLFAPQNQGISIETELRKKR